MQASPTYAALDLGSNSFHLLVAHFQHGKLVVLDDLKLITQLAAGFDENKNLSLESIERALHAIRLFADRLRVIDKQYLRITGTSSLRQAHNAEVFLAAAEAILEAPIEIITGEEEARLIFLGVNKDYSSSLKRLIIDIGGGSTECVIGLNEPEHLKSLHIGCVVYATKYFTDGIISQKNYQSALLAARAEIRLIAQAVKQTHWQEAVGASGTIRAIAQVIGKNYQQAPVTLQSIERLAQDMIDAGHCKKLKLAALSENRRYILPGGLAILHALFIELGIEEIIISHQAIREGIIYEMDGRSNFVDRQEKTISQLQEQYHVDHSQAKNVADNALFLLKKLEKAPSPEAESLLNWAARLHEVGLSVNHSGYQKHGAYIIENSSMPGFSIQMQQKIAYLVLNHRRKIRSRPIAERISQSQSLLMSLRLAHLFCRYRQEVNLPEPMFLTLSDNDLKITLAKTWLESYPLVLASLQQEKQYLKAQGIRFYILDEQGEEYA